MRSRGFIPGVPIGTPPKALRRSLPLLLLLVSMWVLSGCVVTPIAAQDGSTPAGSAATIAIAPISGEPGDTIFVSGAGWAANESVYVNLEQSPDEEPIQTTVAIATTDENGRFTLTFTYPVDPIWREPGMIEVVAYSVETDAQAVATFEVLESEPVEEEEPTPTSSPTPAPTSGATAQPTATRPAATPTARPQGNIGTVVSSALNVRTGPSTAFPIITRLSRGATFTVVGQNNSGAWLFVRLNNGTEGWLARAYTDYSRIAPVVPSPKPPAPTPVPTSTRPPQGSGWRGEYYNNSHLSGDPVLVRDDANIDFDWGYGSPAYGVNNDYFSVRWVRSFYLPAGTYRFSVEADDGVRVWVNGEQIINEWHLASGRTYSVQKRVDSGSALVRVEYYEATQIAKIRFRWEPVDQQSYPDWRGEYYSNRDLSGSPAFVRNDTGINFDWGTGSPAENFPANDFSVRWTRDQHFDAGTYRFHATTDDGMRVYLDDALIIDEWRNGSAREVTRDIWVGHGTHRLRVEYYEDAAYAVARFWWERIDDQPNDFPDWKGEYWDNRHLDGDPDVVRNDRKLDFNWGSGSPDSRIPNDNFSARWTRWVDFDDARYRFYVRADDGVRVWVGDERIINEWHDNSADNTYTAEIKLKGNKRVRVEYYERTVNARIRVWWEKIGDGPTPTPTRIEPYVDVSPSQGPTGTTVRVSGGGFPANTTVNLYLGGVAQEASAAAASAQVRASTTTNNSGGYSMEFAIPNTWPDGSPVEPGRLVVLVATQDFNVEATAIFDVTGSQSGGGNPYAQVSPSSGGAGTRVTVSGGGFPANRRVRAYLAGLATASALSADDEPRSYASTTTDDQGNYSLSFTMPEEWPDDDDIETGKLIILIATDDFGVTASADFDYFHEDEVPNASINVSPRSGGAGTSVTVNGGGFPANSDVNLYLGALDSQVGGSAGDRIYARTTTDRRGNYSMAFTMPSQWPDGSSVASGRIAIVVANSDFSIVVGSSFDYTASGTPAPTPSPTNTVVAPTPTRAPSANVNPGAGGEGTRVTVSGNGFPANVTVNAYLAEFGENGGFAGDAVSYATTTTDGDGNYSLSFTMPRTWPDGDRIDDGRILIVIATNDFGHQASAVFSYDDDLSVAGQSTGELATVEPTATPVTPTDTPLPTNTPEPTATEVPTEVPTNTPEPTEPPTNTPEPPTNTPEPTATPVPPTNTPEPPTATPVPPTNTPEPTATPVPPTVAPTNTPVPEPTTAPVEEPTEPPASPVPTEVTEEPTAEPPQEQPPAEEGPTEGQGGEGNGVEGGDEGSGGTEDGGNEEGNEGEGGEG
jgi:hypothetical protein